jgi:hypothetical protein
MTLPVKGVTAAGKNNLGNSHARRGPLRLSTMLLKVIAIESIKPMAFVSLLFNDSNQISCRKTLPSEPLDAVARRYIAKGESVTFDSGQDTDDLLRPHTEHYKPYVPR